MRGFLVTLGILTTLTAMAAFRPAALAGQSAPREEAVDAAADAVG